MDRAVLMILIIFIGTIIGLILTADNEPTPIVIEEKPEKSHLVDTIPSHRSIHNTNVIKNPYIDFNNKQ